MDIIDENKCKEFKYILAGCRTQEDAKYFADIYISRYPEIKNIIFSIINGKRYDNILDFKTIQSVLNTTNSFQYRDDIEELIQLNISKTIDNIQKTTFEKILNAKLPKFLSKEKITNSIQSVKQTITKQCPHCNHDHIDNHDTIYVICGYQNSRIGYDHIGCGKDWCFQCNKILCKSWIDNELFLKINRIHNDICCKKHAEDSHKNYPDDYCICTNDYVNRSIKVNDKKL